MLFTVDNDDNGFYTGFIVIAINSPLSMSRLTLSNARNFLNSITIFFIFVPIIYTNLSEIRRNTNEINEKPPYRIASVNKTIVDIALAVVIYPAEV